MRPRRAQPLVRLTEADPSFYDWAPDRKLNPQHAGRPDRRGVGIIFECPIHVDCNVGVRFANALDGGGPLDEPGYEGRPTWHRTGETFDTLTLTPSIRVVGGADGCEWHGFIRNGAFESCSDSR